MEIKNKYNILISNLIKLRVNKKDFDKIYKIDLKNKIAFYISVDKKYIFRHSITPFTTRKQFFSNGGLPMPTKVSGIYNQSKYRTKEIDRFINDFSKQDKELKGI